MKNLGQLLLWCGFLSGALATVFQAKDNSGLGLTIPWFVVSVVVLVAGIVLIWKARGAVEDDQITEGNIENLKRAISHLVQQSSELIQLQDKVPPSQIVQKIDDDCALDFQNFADSRKSIISGYGLTSYAEIMTQFAAGERAMNRVWSAAADGYVDEAKTYLQKSHEHLCETQRLLSELKSGEN